MQVKDKTRIYKYGSMKSTLAHTKPTTWSKGMHKLCYVNAGSLQFWQSVATLGLAKHKHRQLTP